MRAVLELRTEQQAGTAHGAAAVPCRMRTHVAAGAGNPDCTCCAAARASHAALARAHWTPLPRCSRMRRRARRRRARRRAAASWAACSSCSACRRPPARRAPRRCRRRLWRALASITPPWSRQTGAGWLASPWQTRRHACAGGPHARRTTAADAAALPCCCHCRALVEGLFKGNDLAVSS